MKILHLILLVVIGLHGFCLSNPIRATKIVDKKSISELSIIYRQLFVKRADGTRLITFQEYRAFHQRLLDRVSSNNVNILELAERWGINPLDVAGELLAKDCFRAMSIALEGISKNKDSAKRLADLEYIAQAIKSGDDLAIDGLIEMTISAKGAIGSRDVGELILNLTTYRGSLEQIRSLKSIFGKMGRIGEAPGHAGNGVVGVHYSRHEDYASTGMTGSPINLKPKTHYGSIYDPLQRNKSPSGLRGGIHEVDTGDFLATPANGYDLLMFGRKFMTATERLSDVDAVAFERALGNLHFIQAKSSNRALQGGAEKFGTHMEKQLAQLPTSGNYAATKAPLGELCGKHVRFAVPEGAITEDQTVAAIKKMIDGMEKDAKMPRGKLIENIKKGLGIDPADAEEFVFSEADKFFIPIPQTPL